MASLFQETISKVTIDENPDASSNSVSDAITSVIDEIIPVKTVKMRHKKLNKPWIPAELL